MTVPLRFDRYGGHQTLPVVLLHSVGLDRTFWAPVARMLMATHTVLCVDLRGHGESPAPAGEWLLEDFSDDVAALLATTGVGRAHVVGQSFGGLVAQHLAIRHPGLVESLVLSGTSCTTPPADRDVFLTRARSATLGGMSAVASAAINRWFTETGLEDQVVEQVRTRLQADDPTSWAKTFRAIAKHNVLEDLRALQAPTLVVVGDADTATPPRYAYEMTGALPIAEIRIMAYAPHLVYLEQPCQFARVVAKFLASQRKEHNL